jgi:ATP-dependent exoDNAse (exonuclease V) beta subunit
VKGATIVDYKTGAVGRSAESLAETISNYSEQMHAYCAAVEDMWKLDPASVRATLLFVDRDEVVRVEPRPVVA